MLQEGPICILSTFFSERRESLPCSWLVPKHVFEKLIESSSSPDLGTLCKNFKKSWPGMDHKNFQTAICDVDAPPPPGLNPEVVTRALQHAVDLIQKPHIRADYEYLLRLVIIFLGGTPPGGVRFRPPMALSSARFMGRIIYCLSIDMFATSGEFEVPADLLQKLRDVNIFFTTTFVEPWFAANHAVSAPRRDLELLKALIKYKEISPEISKVAVGAFKNHLWYLSQHNIALSLFDPVVPDEEKRLIVLGLDKKDNKKKSSLTRFQPPKNVNDLLSLDLSHFASQKSRAFFEIVGVDSEFLTKDPSCWPSLPSYNEAMKSLNNLEVINDCAERAVAIVKEFNNSITKNESDYQNLLLVMKRERSGSKDERTVNSVIKIEDQT